MRCAKAMLVVFCALLVAGTASAQKLYKYVDENGRTRYTDRPPIDMTGRASDVLNSQGTVVRRNAAAMTPEELAAREEEERKKREAAALVREEERKRRSLLATYSSSQEIDDARERALANNAESSRQIKLRIQSLEARRAKVEQEVAKFKDKPLPEDVKREAYEVESDLRAQRSLLDAKEKEVEAIKARYDEDKRQYLRYVTGVTTPPAPPVATKTP